MAWGNVRKEDKPYSFNEEGLVLVEYSKDGRLYLVKNINEIAIGEDDYLAVSYIPANAEDSHLPVACVKSLGMTSKYFNEICNWLNFNPNVENTEIKPRYHEENVIKNISREDNNSEQGGMTVTTVNPSTGEKVTVSSNNPYRPSPQNPNSSNEDFENPEADNSCDNSYNSNGGVNESEESNYDSFLEELMQEEDIPPEPVSERTRPAGSIFTFIKKIH